MATERTAAALARLRRALEAVDYEGDATSVAKSDLRRVLNSLSHARAAGAKAERTSIIDLVQTVRRARQQPFEVTQYDFQTAAREDAEDELEAAIIAAIEARRG